MIDRLLKKRLQDAFTKKVSFFLLGPRQTGKTTIVEDLLKRTPHIEYNFMEVDERLRFERSPNLLKEEILGQKFNHIFIDEVQKIPELLDNIQVLIDKHRRIFAITGSSARKLRRSHANLLPGRVITFRMDPLLINEYTNLLNINSLSTLKKILTYGELPGIFSLVLDGKEEIAKEFLFSYVNTYIEEEVRAESLVRKIGAFSRFIKMAAEESGRLISLRGLSQDIGIPHQTAAEYYQILEDCLIVERIDSLKPSSERHKLRKAPKYLFFDLGVINAATGLLGASDFMSEYWGRLFEQWVGLTILRYMRTRGIHGTLFYWRDYCNREVDWVIEMHNRWIPIEVKWSENITNSHCQHIKYFFNKYQKKVHEGYVISPGGRVRRVDDKISILPFHSFLEKIFPK